MTYTAASDGTIKFVNGPATQMFCRDDYDDFYYRALLSAVKYTESKGLYTFFDTKGQSVASFTLIQADPVVVPVVATPNLQGSASNNANVPVNSGSSSSSTTTITTTSKTTTNPSAPSVSTPIAIPPITLPGKYKVALPQFSLQVLDNSLIYRGCNTYRYPCIFKTDKIFIGKPIITNKNCDNSTNNQTD